MFAFKFAFCRGDKMVIYKDIGENDPVSV